MSLRLPPEIQTRVLAAEDRNEQEARPDADERTSSTRLGRPGSLAMPDEEARLAFPENR